MTALDIKKLAERSIPCPPSTCVLWTGCVNKGYGVLWMDGQNRSVHRLVWELHYGRIAQGMCVCHRCDVSLCVNPDHLFLGTHTDNRADCVTKGRQAKGDRSALRLYPELRLYGDKNPSRLYPERLTRGDDHWTRVFPEKVLRGDKHPMHKAPIKGERNGCSKLTDEAVRSIRMLWLTGKHTQRDLAARFNVTQTAIYYVVNGKTWTHVKL